MPTLRNPKHEKFAQLVSSGMTAQAAFTQAGFNATKRTTAAQQRVSGQTIEELQIRNEKKAEMAALSRDELIGILAEIVHAARIACLRLG